MGLSGSGSGSGRTWDAASSPAAVGLARRYEAAWRGGQRPDPGDYLPRDPDSRPGALLALLRADLGLRREAGEPARVESYLRRHPDLAPDAVVALLYEEFCLREEAGEAPAAAEYYARFPALVAPLGRVLEIHELVGSGRSEGASFGLQAAEVPLPEAGQTIAGFHLVEELGRGAFGRVFLARERQLADRPVALKVARRGSREPQALARLQHTHIVPVHSYRLDQATGLHLLCMPYLGRVTLAQVLADPASAVARSGADLVEVVDRHAPPEAASGAGAGRRELASRPFARAVAWWGARLAEALQHAHERGVLHRDVKPSNVLILADGTPMLLDFNLAQGPILDEAATDEGFTAPGGTLAYMAPEHLDALARGDAEGVDARCDVYALGVVLYEALASTRPFPPPTGALSVEDALHRAAEQRRAGAEPLRGEHPEVPPALEAVVARCLAPDPAGRYASAAELAADLQAVADDGPLQHAREPQPFRALRWARRRRRPLGALAFASVTMAIIGWSASDGLNHRKERRGEVLVLMKEGQAAEDKGQFAQAATQFDSASKLAQGRPELVDLFFTARTRHQRALEIAEAGARAATLSRRVESLKFRIFGMAGEAAAVAAELKETLAPFFVFQNPNWFRLRVPSMLDVPRRDRLKADVDELLFLWVWKLAGSGDPAVALDGLALCDRALAFTATPGPWRALRAYLSGQLGQRTPRGTAVEASATEDSARACLKWGLYCRLVGRNDLAQAWLERATRIEPDDYWTRYILSSHYYYGGHLDEAMQQCEAAVALAPGSYSARLNRARMLKEYGNWGPALDDLQKALDLATQPSERARARLELGIARRELGDVVGARGDFEAAVATEGSGPLARRARLNLALLDQDAGDPASARAGFAGLIAEDASDEVAQHARLGRAQIALRSGRAREAEADLTAVIGWSPGRRGAFEPRGLKAEALAKRAEARLLLGEADAAEADAEAALRSGPRPRLEWLRDRARLASARSPLHRLDRPDEIARWPNGGPPLAADLRAAAERLRPAAEGADAEAALPARLGRAAIFSALGDRRAAGAESDRAIALAPGSPQALLLRARVRRRSGDRPGALADANRALNLDPSAPRLLELRGALALDLGDPVAALADLDLARSQGADATAWDVRARALMALGRDEEAVIAWTAALARDPDDPCAYLGRARALARTRRPDAALADLEKSAALAGTDPALLARVALAYATLLRDRPDRLPRLAALARLALLGRPESPWNLAVWRAHPGRFGSR